MENISFQFDLNDFNEIFPFFMLMDKELVIIEHGNSLPKFLPDCKQKEFASIFSIERPITEVISFEKLKDTTNQLVILKANCFLNKKFRGQFKYLSDKQYLIFIGAPWFDTSEEFNQSNLELRDYAPHNPTVDLLYVLKTQEIANEDMKQVLAKMGRQKKEMEIAQEKLNKTKNELEESNKRYEYVNKATSEAIWDWNILTGEVYFGEGFNKLFGINIKSLKNDFNILNERIHPEDFERITGTVQQMLQSQECNWTEEYRFLKADNQFAFVADKGFIIRDEQGHPLRMIGSIQDITQRKQEEQYLKLMEAVIKNTNDSVIISEIKNDYPIVFVNGAFTKMTGYSFEEVKGKNPRFLQGPETDKEAMRKINEGLKKWEICEATTINYRKNGDAFWVNFSLSPVVNEKGEYTHWISVERDVTATIKNKEALINQKQFTEDILNNVPTDIAVFDPDHNYIFINQHAIRNKEIRDWMIGKNDFDYVRYKGIDDSMAKIRWSQFEESVENKTKVEWVDEHKDEKGNSIYKLRIFAPFFENKKLKFVIGYGVDVSETKKAELKILNAMEALKQSNSELEQFAYVASHDLQEPLRMVTSFLTQLEKKYSSQLDDKAKEYIYYAVDGAKRMRQIILDLLEFSRIGKMNDKLTSIDLNELIDEIRILYNNQIEELGALITKQNLPVIVGYKTPLRQLFQNIISNSLKYHREGVPPRIQIEVKATTDSWEFSISDNGIGIEEQYFHKIFEIFQRLHNKDEYAGTGIGLAITRKIIEQMHGRIWVTSTFGKGTTFHFTLPFKQNDLPS